MRHDYNVISPIVYASPEFARMKEIVRQVEGPPPLHAKNNGFNAGTSMQKHQEKMRGGR